MDAVTRHSEPKPPTAPATLGTAPARLDGMSKILGLAAAALTLALASPAIAAQSEPRLSQSGALVWATDGSGTAATFRLRIDPDGSIREERTSGILVAARGEIFRWSARQVPVPTGLACESFGETGAPEPGTGTLVSLVPVRTDAASHPMSVSRPDYAQGLEVNMFTESVELTASLGPYLFVHQNVFSYTCGAHGGEYHDAFVFDAESGRRVALYAAAEEKQLEREFAGQALHALDAEQILPGTPLTLTASHPVYDDAGLRMDHQWTANTCYACSDGQWDSYTMSTHVTSVDMPKALRGAANAASDAARWLHRMHPELRVGGVSFPGLVTP